jgi:hypothetical protein
MLKCINNANIPYCLKYFQFAFITEGSIGTLTDVVLGTLQVHAQRCTKEQPSMTYISEAFKSSPSWKICDLRLSQLTFANVTHLQDKEEETLRQLARQLGG